MRVNSKQYEALTRPVTADTTGKVALEVIHLEQLDDYARRYGVSLTYCSATYHGELWEFGGDRADLRAMVREHWNLAVWWNADGEAQVADLDEDPDAEQLNVDELPGRVDRARGFLSWLREQDHEREPGVVPVAVADPVDVVDLAARVELLEQLTTCDERGTTVAERRAGAR